MLKPLTILDDILSNNVDHNNIILDDPKDTLILQHLFSAISSNEQYHGNQYIWNAFKAFINQKRLEIELWKFHYYCNNKALLGLILSDLQKIGDNEEYSEEKYRNKNMIKSEILSIFRNVTSFVYGLDQIDMHFRSNLYYL